MLGLEGLTLLFLQIASSLYKINQNISFKKAIDSIIFYKIYGLGLDEDSGFSL